jgi:hypothetical protein
MPKDISLDVKTVTRFVAYLENVYWAQEKLKCLHLWAFHFLKCFALLLIFFLVIPDEYLLGITGNKF